LIYIILKNKYYINNFRRNIVKDYILISKQIDQFATQACRIMTKTEREKFFKDTDQRRTYLHGKNAGKERKLYIVDGVWFNEVWKLVYPYVLTSCARSVYYNPDEIADVVSEIKYWMFKGLQLYGPVFHSKTFSQRMGVIVNMILTNEHKKKLKRLQIRSLESINEDGEVEQIEIRDNQSNMDHIDFWLSIPQKFEVIVKQLISGNTLTETSRNCNIPLSELKNELKFVVSNVE